MTDIIQQSNQEELEQLAQQIIFEPDDFNLLFARINVQTHRDQLIADLKILLKADDIEVVEIATDIRTENLLAHLEQAIALRENSNKEFCLSITGLDATILRPDSNILNHLNLSRELFRSNTPYPILVWLSESALTRLAQIAPDFWAWRSGVFEFADDLKDSLAEFTLANGTRPTPSYLCPPNPPISFIGRKDIRQQLIESLAESSETEPQIIGLIGLGGIGKSALAARIAHDATLLFPGGVLWLPLNGANLLELYQKILQAYGAPLHGSDPIKTLSEIKNLLQQYRPLLILDNADQYPLVKTIVNELDGLATFLITSRNSSLSPPHASLFSVDALSLSEAVRLLSTRLNISETELIQDKNLNSSIQTLCVKLGFLPLAITVATGYIQSCRITPDEYLKRLDNHLKHLGNHPSLGFVLEQAYSRLNQGQQSLLALMAMDRGDTIHIDTLTAVTSVMESTNPQQTRLKIFRIISTLLTHGLVNDAQSGRYQLHRLVRSLVQRKLSNQESIELQINLLDYYLQYVEEHNEYTAEGYNALDEAFSNIRGAMDMAYELQRWPTVVQFARHLCDFSTGYLVIRGYRTELCKRLEQGISAARLIGQKSNEAYLPQSFDDLFLQQNDHVEARQYYQSALELFQNEGDLQGEALTLSQLGTVAQAEGNYEQAETYYQRILTINNEAENKAEKARVLLHLGNLAQHLMQFQQAEAHFQQALQIYIELNDRYSQASTYHQLGRIAQEQSEWALAHAYYLQVLAMYIELNDPYSQATIYHNLGRVAQSQDELAEAQVYYQQALAIKIEFNDRYSQANIYHQLGTIAQAQYEWAQAQAYYQQTLEIKIEFNDRYSQANIYDLLGMVAQEQRQWTQAQAHYQQALEIKSELHDRNSQASTYEQLGRVAQAQHQQAQAQAYYQRALDISQNVITQPPVE